MQTFKLTTDSMNKLPPQINVGQISTKTYKDACLHVIVLLADDIIANHHGELYLH